VQHYDVSDLMLLLKVTSTHKRCCKRSPYRLWQSWRKKRGYFIPSSSSPLLAPVAIYLFITELHTEYKIDKNKNTEWKEKNKTNKKVVTHTTRIQFNTHSKEHINNIVT